MQPVKKEHFVALFDVLGFKSRLDDLKLEGMLEKYEKLINIVDSKNTEQDGYEDGEFHGAFFIMSKRELKGYPPALVINEIRGAYASDSIVVWGNSYLLGTPVRLGAKFISPPVFCDPFLDVCNEIMCHAIEIGLPLRGGISSGMSVMDKVRSIYLGQPIVDAAIIEGKHNFIGASFDDNFSGLSRSDKYFINFKKHLKKDKNGKEQKLVSLDWVRHWQQTRDNDLHKIISSLNTDSNFSHYYENTVDLIKSSAKRELKMEEISNQIIFPGIHFKQLWLPVREIK
ncbi:MAG TPA: hypothetical protein EYG73_02585 [Arcobacter sp.]|nr:hypothetical protein [Arcobacter sp.]